MEKEQQENYMQQQELKEFAKPEYLIFLFREDNTKDNWFTKKQQPH